MIDKSDRIHNDYSTIIIENYDLPEEIKKYKYRSKCNKNILKRIRNTIKGRRVNANNRWYKLCLIRKRYLFSNIRRHFQNWLD